jgi:hypothetical protein
MNWRAIVSTLSQACLTVYNTSREIVNEVREAVSPQGVQRSYKAVRDASLSYFQDLRDRPLVLLNPLTPSMAPFDIFLRLNRRDQERIMIQAGFFGGVGLASGVLPLSPLLAGVRTLISNRTETVEQSEALGRSLREVISIGKENSVLISPAGTPSLEDFRRGN